MPEHVTVAFDIPQNYPPVHSRIHQDERQYENQRVSIPWPEAYSTMGVISDDRVLSHFYHSPQPYKDFKEDLEALHKHYIFLDDDRTIIRFFETHPAISSLLMGAVEPLRGAFGDRRLIYIRIQSSDEDSLLKVAVLLPADFGNDPELALQSFDEEWWLNNCHSSGGTLVFDYEMQNAI
jgi:hypothetical protein